VTRALLALLAVLALAGCGSDDEPQLTGKERVLATALRDGGVVLVMRHTKTETATDEVEVLGDCGKQRNLSEEGREQARRIGRDVEALGVPVAEVRASPLCRAKETADLAFGRSTVDKVLVSPGVTGTIEDDDRRIAQLKGTTSAPPGKATVLVTHTGNIGGAFDQSVEEGDVLVFRDGKLLGVVKPSDWSRFRSGT
jgi:phosphohistidine phosphatase SixA